MNTQVNKTIDVEEDSSFNWLTRLRKKDLKSKGVMDYVRATNEGFTKLINKCENQRNNLKELTDTVTTMKDEIKLVKEDKKTALNAAKEMIDSLTKEMMLNEEKLIKNKEELYALKMDYETAKSKIKLVKEDKETALNEAKEMIDSLTKEKVLNEEKLVKNKEEMCALKVDYDSAKSKIKLVKEDKVTALNEAKEMIDSLTKEKMLNEKKLVKNKEELCALRMDYDSAKSTWNCLKDENTALKNELNEKEKELQLIKAKIDQKEHADEMNCKVNAIAELRKNKDQEISLLNEKLQLAEQELKSSNAENNNIFENLQKLNKELTVKIRCMEQERKEERDNAMERIHKRESIIDKLELKIVNIDNCLRRGDDERQYDHWFHRKCGPCRQKHNVLKALRQLLPVRGADESPDEGHVDEAAVNENGGARAGSGTGAGRATRGSGAGAGRGATGGSGAGAKGGRGVGQAAGRGQDGAGRGWGRGRGNGRVAGRGAAAGAAAARK